MGYMVNLAVKGRPAAVIGGGEIAARKVLDLLAAGAAVTVVAPEACAGLLGLAEQGRIVLHRRPYATEDLSGSFIAVSATDDEEVNARVAHDAQARNVPVNVVDRPALCTFTVPATVSRGDLTLAVATEGRCPALAGILREELQHRYGDEYAALVELCGELRRTMIGLDWSGRRIRETLAQLYQEGVMELLAAGNRPALQDFLRSHLGPGFPLPL